MPSPTTFQEESPQTSYSLYNLKVIPVFYAIVTIGGSHWPRDKNLSALLEDKQISKMVASAVGGENTVLSECEIFPKLLKCIPINSTINEIFIGQSPKFWAKSYISPPPKSNVIHVIFSKRKSTWNSPEVRSI